MTAHLPDASIELCYARLSYGQQCQRDDGLCAGCAEEETL